MPHTSPVDYEKYLQPENELEAAFLEEPDFVAGLDWGVPRYGHPEGEIYKHIREVFTNIDRLDISAELRRQLRIIALVHDTFKYKEDKSYPRDWTRHHSILAREFLERHTDETALLVVTELHDEAYYVWRLLYMHQNIEQGEKRLAELLDQIGLHRQLYYLFYYCDTRTGDKNPAPLEWFEANIPGIELVER